MDAFSVLVVGSSWHASVLVEAIESGGRYRVAGYLDDKWSPGTLLGAYRVLGALGDIAQISARHLTNQVVIAIGDNWLRRKIYSDLVAACPELSFPVISHPSAIIATSAEVRRGAVLLAGSHVGSKSQIGEFCIVNTGSSIDHDCTLHSFSSMAPGVFMGGLVQIGECSAMGVGVSISDRICIGNHVVVGTGAVVVRDLPDCVVAYGNPARVVRSRTEGEPYIRTPGGS